MTLPSRKGSLMELGIDSSSLTISGDELFNAYAERRKIIESINEIFATYGLVIFPPFKIDNAVGYNGAYSAYITGKETKSLAAGTFKEVFQACLDYINNER